MITPKPITAADNVDQSRDSSGLNRWTRSSPIIEFIMFILGWFCIPVEVFLRKDFGQRWFNAINFYAGFFLLLIFASVQYAIDIIWEKIAEFVVYVASSINPLYTPAEEGWFSEHILDRSMLFFLIAYTLMGSYHLFKVWWRNRTNMALHSFDNGTSRLEPIARYLIPIINAITVPVIWLYIRLIPKKQRTFAPQPELINDRTAFTNAILEPLVLFILAEELTGIVSLWLIISAISLAIHATWREIAKLNKVLDFRDSVLDAKVMMDLRQQTLQSSPQNKMMQQVASSIRETPQITAQMIDQYPDLMHIIEEMNRDKPHLSV